MISERKRAACRANFQLATQARSAQMAALRVERVCPNCEQPFTVPPSLAHRIYCSNACRYAHKRGERGANAGGGAWMRGENNPRYTGSDWRERERWQRERHAELAQWRRRVFARDNYSCQHCGISPIEHNRLRAHHIKPWATHPELRLDVANGLTLCHPCHLSVHRA